MKPFSILMIRLLGLYLFLKTLFSVLPALFMPNVGEFWTGELLPVLLATVGVPMVGGVLLWCFAGRLADRLHGDSDSTVAATDEGLVSAGIFLIGVYLVVRHIGMLVGAYSTTGAVAYDALVIVVAGLCMILGGGAIVALYHRVKTLGVDW
ncbi:hypothetical protein HNO52_06140 [Billgrantia diversa]|uniref:hypothetical protein n=1 Tax=Halomonas sp. MCCC 1A13316 TaxID=2733487 RepID=UPI0018A48B3F|nr:hypothetical protein [Halomonas sp. MCCC 1A13316]QOR38133.1 hypothetical protein HNO52_06140 [Halomonas sp. MCCC 1A13316]